MSIKPLNNIPQSYLVNNNKTDFSKQNLSFTSNEAPKKKNGLKTGILIAGVLGLGSLAAIKHKSIKNFLSKIKIKNDILTVNLKGSTFHSKVLFKNSNYKIVDATFNGATVKFADNNIKNSIIENSHFINTKIITPDKKEYFIKDLKIEGKKTVQEVIDMVSKKA